MASTGASELNVTARLESKESISEIKSLRSELALAQGKNHQLQGQLASARAELAQCQEQLANQPVQVVEKTIERDSLEMGNQIGNQTDVESLERENKFNRGRLNQLTDDFNQLLEKVYQKK